MSDTPTIQEQIVAAKEGLTKLHEAQVAQWQKELAEAEKAVTAQAGTVQKAEASVTAGKRILRDKQAVVNALKMKLRLPVKPRKEKATTEPAAPQDEASTQGGQDGDDTAAD